jgi:exodeoxyribonuclease-1
MKLIKLATPAPFVYTSGRYEEQYQKTTVAYPLAPGAYGKVMVYDLRYDPTEWIAMSQTELKKKLTATWEERKKEGFVSLPVKELNYGQAPAVAPLGVLNHGGGWKRIGLDEVTVEKHLQLLAKAPEFAENLRIISSEKPAYPTLPEPEARIYDGFLSDLDRLRVETVRNATVHDLAGLNPEFQDERLPELLLHYKARNFPQSLSQDEAAQWEQWRAGRINRQMPAFARSLHKLAAETSDEGKQFILQELQLWAESVLPADMYDRAEEQEVWLA